MTAGLVLAAIVVLAAVSGRTGLPGALVLALVSLVWLRVNGSAEGAVLWSLTPSHGLTETDLAGLAGLGVAGWRGFHALRQRADRQA